MKNGAKFTIPYLPLSGQAVRAKAQFRLKK